MAGTRFQSRVFTILDDNGVIADGAKVYFYATGTSTPQATYNNADLDPGHANTNPVVYGADGRQSVDIYLDPGLGAYRVVYKDKNGNTLAEDDPVSGNDITDAIAAHNADPDAHIDATESSRGWTQYATDTEAQAMSADGRSLTPANLAALTPTTTRPGLVERATTAEIEAGTDDLRYISPLGAQDLQATSAEIRTGTDTKHFMGVANFAANASVNSTDMSITFPGGLTLKGGRRQSTTDAAQTFTFAAAFANNCYGVTLTRQVDEEGSTAEYHVSEATPPTTTGFTIDRDDDPDYGNGWFYFMAWGN